MENIHKLYTWKDIDRLIKKYFEKIDCSYITDIEVYYDEIVISLSDMAGKNDAKCELNKILGSHYDIENDVVKYDLFKKSIEIVWVVDESEKSVTKIVPLFKDIIYRDNSYEQEIIRNSELENCPIIAFHSYKGGVGRTLSLSLVGGQAFSKAASYRLRYRGARIDLAYGGKRRQDKSNMLF